MAYDASDYEAITLERRGAVAILTLNRPDRLNAISTAPTSSVAPSEPTARNVPLFTLNAIPSDWSYPIRLVTKFVAI